LEAVADLAMAPDEFGLDRARWNVLHGSGKLFENLGKHLVNDLISFQFQLKLVATSHG